MTNAEKFKEVFGINTIPFDFWDKEYKETFKPENFKFSVGELVEVVDGNEPGIVTHVTANQVYVMHYDGSGGPYSIENVESLSVTIPEIKDIMEHLKDLHDANM